MLASPTRWVLPRFYSTAKIDLKAALRNKHRLRLKNSEIHNIDRDDDPAKPLSQKYRRELEALIPGVQVARKQAREKAPGPRRRRPEARDTRALLQKTAIRTFKHPFKVTTRPTHIPPRRETHRFEGGDVHSIGRLDTGLIPRLAHELDRTLFQPGVHFLQDPRTRIYNFTPYLKNIIKLEDFRSELLDKFVAVLKDEVLLKASTDHGARFFSSTSSMTSTLIQFYLFLNDYRVENTKRFAFPKFTKTALNLPASMIVVPKGKGKHGDTVWAVETDKSADREILLGALGHCLEALLTHEPHEFSKYDLRVGPPPKQEPPQNIYNYAQYGAFLMRSQLDCYDPRLPGKGTFDLKTRAVCSIRYDSANPNLANNTYQIWKLTGQYELFQREYHDLIRLAGLLKYLMQARIGQMDGIFVAYHNINTFFGFQYLPLEDIDKTFYSQDEEVGLEEIRHLDDVGDALPSLVADHQFKMSMDMWQRVLDAVIEDIDKSNHKGSPFRLVVKSMKQGDRLVLRVCAVPLSKGQVKGLQNFSALFKTGFREDPATRAKQLRQHADRLDAFNENTVVESEVGVLNYEVKAAFGKEKAYPYPSSGDDLPTMKYTINSLPRGPSLYLALLKELTLLLSKTTETKSVKTAEKPTLEIDDEDRGNAMRVYAAVGKARMEQWAEKDKEAVVFETNRKAVSTK